MGDARDLLRETAELAADFLDSLDRRPVFPSAGVEELRARLGGPLPEGPSDPRSVVAKLADAADLGIVGMAGGRYFGFVIGGGVPAALAADWLTSAWDQNAGLYVGGPAASVAEEVAGGWLAELLGLPRDVSFAFVTGCQMAHVTALAAARQHVLREAGWDVERDGLVGARPIRVLAGAKRHVTIDRALRLLGLGTAAVVEIPADAQGRMIVEALRDVLRRGEGPTIVCVQAGEVNTGAFDPIPAIADLATQAGAWLHVDGAFGLWAAASPRLRHLVEGVERADSWATDAHKWLNVPYDSGLVFCAHADSHRAAMSATASYLVQSDGERRDQVDWTPEFSRRARGFSVYAAVRSLGRSGVAELVERCCRHARRFADELARLPGAEVLNEVVLNQVLFRYETDERTAEVLQGCSRAERLDVRHELGGRAAIRVSVSNWQTTDEDVERTLAEFARAASMAAHMI